MTIRKHILIKKCTVHNNASTEEKKILNKSLLTT